MTRRLRLIAAPLLLYAGRMQHAPAGPTPPCPTAWMTALLALVLGGCATPTADRPARLMGYGTPGVLSYGAGTSATTAAGLQKACDASAPPSGGPPPPQTLDAACDQLRRSMHNQPGNSTTPG